MSLSRCRPLFVFLAVMMVVALLAGAAASMQAQTPYFRSFSGVGIADGNRNENGEEYFLIPFEDFQYLEGSTPRKTFITRTHQYSGDRGTLTYHGYATTQYRGFYSTGSYSFGEVLNAYYPFGKPEGTLTPPFGYYLFSGGGSWMKHRFVSPEAAFGPYAVFRWNVSGTEEKNIGRATARIDFAVTDMNITSFNDLYSDGVAARRLTEFGPGLREYHVPIILGTPLNFLFWSSTFWQVNPSELKARALAGTLPYRIYGKAMYMNTFDLLDISLYNEDGSPIRQWSLVDESTGLELYNQNGRVTLNFVPEPGALALAASALLPLLLLARSRRVRRK